MPHQFESGLFVREPAWHKLGVVLDNPPTIADAIIQSGLNWTVEERSLYVADYKNNTVIKVPGRKALVRSTDQFILGDVSSTYTPVQNTEAFNWFDFLLHDGDASIESAGSLKSGKRIWVLVKLNITAEAKSGDEIVPYILLHNSHDGTLSLGLNFTAVRVVCANTLAMATSRHYEEVKENKALTFRHSSGIKEKMEQAKLSIDLAKQRFNQSISDYKAMNYRDITSTKLDEYYSLVFNTEDVKTELRDYNKLLSLFESGMGNSGSTYFDAYNSITEYATHIKGRNQDSRLNSLWFGDSANLLSRAHQLALS